MAEQHVQIFKAIGVPDDVITRIEAITPETLKDFKVDEYTGSISTTFENKFLNDAGFLGKIPMDKIPEPVKKLLETGQYERFLNEMKAVAKELDIDITDIDETTQRQLKPFTRTVLQKYGTKKGATNEQITKVQNELQTALQEKTKAEEKANGMVTEAVKTTSQKYQGVLQKMLAQQTISAIEDLITPAKYIVDAVNGQIAAQYAIVFDEATMEMKLMQKDNPALKALDKAGNEITYKDAAIAILVADNLIKKKEEKKEEEKKKIETVTISGPEGVVIAGNDKITKAIEAEKQNKTK